MVRLASLRAIRDQEQEPKGCGSEKAGEDKGNAQHDSHDRLHGVATDRAYGVWTSITSRVGLLSSRVRIHDAGDRPAPQLSTASKSPSCSTSWTTGRLTI